MIISDLNYLETVSEDILGGNYTQRDRVSLNVRTRIDLQGNSAESFATADAIGSNTFSKTVTDAFVVEDVLSSSSSTSVAAAK